MSLDATLDAALAGQTVTLFTAVKIELPETTLRLVFGAATLIIAGETYTGRDPVFGALSMIEEVSDDAGEAAPRLRVGLMPPDTEGIAALAAPEAQESAVTILFGAINPTTGLVIGTCETLFAGELDWSELDVDVGRQVMSLDVASVWERLFSDSEGARLNTEWHQSIWTGELGLDFLIEATDEPYWGANAPPGSVIAGGSNGFGAGGAGGAFTGILKGLF